MQFSTLSLVTAAFAALSAATPVANLGVRDDAAAAADIVLGLYSTTDCEGVVVEKVTLGSSPSCFTYDPGFASVRVLANPKNGATATIYLQTKCAGAPDVKINLNYTVCHDVGQHGAAHSFHHN